MSTIASPRDPSAPFPRRMHSSQSVTTPTSSSRPSLDTNRSATGSPNPNNSSSNAAPTSSSVPPPAAAKRNRAALREYYNLKKGAGTPPVLEVTDPLGDSHGLYSEVPASEMDRPGFDAEAFVGRALDECGLEELLRTYARVLGEIRALDAEKKGLVYDNYSRLITATETIKKMRANMDPLQPMASTLDPAIAQIYSQASSIREALRQLVPPPDSEEAKRMARRKRTRQLVREVLEVPDRIRVLVKEGREEEARQEWEMPRRLLEKWKAQGLGGDDVDACIRDGEAALNGDEDPGDEEEGEGE